MRTEGIILVDREHNNTSGVLYSVNYPSRVKAKTKDKEKCNLTDVFYFFVKKMLKYIH